HTAVALLGFFFGLVETISTRQINCSFSPLHFSVNMCVGQIGFVSPFSRVQRILYIQRYRSSIDKEVLAERPVDVEVLYHFPLRIISSRKIHTIGLPINISRQSNASGQTTKPTESILIKILIYFVTIKIGKSVIATCLLLEEV